uniref:Uncharacterized protein n=1 Tax=Anguilla anguilla TaxID=7936 RepID=A0A0E9TI71_ANGAN
MWNLSSFQINSQ